MPFGRADVVLLVTTLLSQPLDDLPNNFAAAGLAQTCETITGAFDKANCVRCSDINARPFGGSQSLSLPRC